jgi:PAS domain S-box-containing protein
MKSDLAFLHALLDSMPDLVFVRDSSGRMLYCNKALQEISGKSSIELTSAEAGLWPSGDDQMVYYRDLESRVMALQEEAVIEEQIAGPGGEPHYYQTCKRPIQLPSGETCLLSVSTNIDRIKNYQKEMQRVLQSRNEFFSAMSHEIRTPMNAIIGMSELLLKRNPRKDQLKLLQTLGFSSRNLLHLINEILDFSKMEAGKVEFEQINFNLPELLENIRRSHQPRAETRGLSLELKISRRLPEVINGDPVRLTQVLNNLLSNAVKFTEKGYVRLEARLLQQSDERVLLQFRVADSGIGIPKNRLESVFDPFQQASLSTTRLYGGTGLGLAIVKNIVELQKGTIEVRSREGVGTRISIELPFRGPDESLPLSAHPAGISREARWKMKLRVLYVEDVNTNQLLIDEILGGWGVQVQMAGDGYKALELLAGGEEYDLILMDIQMPGINGYETTRRIRALDGAYFKQVPIIALTASTSDETRHEIFRCGMQDFITKPINTDELRAKIIEHTSVVEEEMTATAPEQALEGYAEVPTGISFAAVDQLFLGNLSRYQEFLRMSIEEFKANQEKLIHAVRDWDLPAFRQVRHRMKSLMSTFGMKDLSAYLDRLRKRLEKGVADTDEQAEISQMLTLQIEHITDVLAHKLASLKWQ